MTKPKKDKAERNRQIALLHCEGVPHTEIAKRAGVHFNTVTLVLKKPEVQALVKQIKNEIDAAVEAAQVAAKVEVPKQIVQATAKALAEKFNAMAPVMAENLQTLALEAESEMVRLKATESWLDRSTDAPKREIHSSHKEERTERRIIIDSAMIRQLHVLAVPEELLDVTPERPELPERFRGMVASDEDQ